ncbi:hypothetical protein QQG55_35085 [Brugia pahangi]
MNIITLSPSLSLSPLILSSLVSSPLSLSLPLSSSSSSSSLSSSLTSTSSPSSSSQSINHQTITNQCGKRHIILDYKHPEYVISFPAASISDNTDYKHSKGSNLVSEEKQNEQFQLPYPLHLYINNDISMSHCQWLITTDSYHSIGAEIEVNNESNYFLNITNENGLQKNCTAKLCKIKSDTSAILVQFRTTNTDNIQSISRFSAKFVILPLSSDQSGAAIVAFWVLLITLIAVLIAFAVIIYLYCMKKKLLFSQFLTILRSKGRKNGRESKERKITLPNGTLITLAYRPGQHGCNVTSAQSQFNSFERMPTIVEETENDIELQVSNRELNDPYR